jgi:hypothetical protein
MKAVYELKRFKNSRNRDLTKALGIYSKNIEPFLRTDTREIIHWLDAYPERYKDQFIILGLYFNDIVIGFAQLAYFIEERIIFVDYIVIEKEFRKNNTFYEFVEEIKEFITAENIEFDFILAEVGGFDDKEPSASTKNLIRLLKMTGFGVVKTNYYHPRLGKTNYESEFQSVLMLYTLNELKHIKKDTYFLFLKTIYFKHYQRWYADFFDEKEKAEYGYSLFKLFKKSREILKKKDSIEINGYLNIYTNNLSVATYKPYKKLAKAIAVFVLFIALLIIFGFIHKIVKNKYKIDTNAQVYIILASAFFLLFILLLFNEKKNHSITSIIEKLLTNIKR